MATAKAKAAEVVAVEHADGSVSLGIVRDGHFVPFVSQSRAYIDQLVENAATREAWAKAAPAEAGGA